jgi:hypothetical protein
MPAPSKRTVVEAAVARLQLRHASPRTIEAYVAWIRRFIRFHDRRHPRELGEREVTAFLSALATERRVAAATQNQALAALLFLYRDVLGAQIGWMHAVVRAKRPAHRPNVLAREDGAAVGASFEPPHAAISIASNSATADGTARSLATHATVFDSGYRAAAFYYGDRSGTGANAIPTRVAFGPWTHHDRFDSRTPQRRVPRHRRVAAALRLRRADQGERARPRRAAGGHPVRRAGDGLRRPPAAGPPGSARDLTAARTAANRACGRARWNAAPRGGTRGCRLRERTCSGTGRARPPALA